MLGNADNAAIIYRPSALQTVLQTARECSVNGNVRTKKGLAQAIGISKERVADIENGFSQISQDLALHWCKACEDQLAYQTIMHMFGCDRPPTDPRLVSKLEQQLVNFVDQAEKGIKSAQKLLKISKDMRPGVQLSDSLKNEIKNLAGQIDDTHQAATCVMESIEMNWKVSQAEVINAWTSEAIIDAVAVRSIDEFIRIEKERAFG